jgi:hypothetical protein
MVKKQSCVCKIEINIYQQSLRVRTNEARLQARLGSGGGVVVAAGRAKGQTMTTLERVVRRENASVAGGRAVRAFHGSKSRCVCVCLPPGTVVAVCVVCAGADELRCFA